MTHKPEAKIVFLGGPHDGLTTEIDTHETLQTERDGAQYVRTDQQLGDHRVYQFTLGDGEAPDAGVVAAGDEGEGLLARDLAALAKDRKERHANPSESPAA